MKTVLFVPGFREDVKSRDYKKVIKAIESKGYNARFVPIKWSRTTLDDWVSELDADYDEYDAKEVVLAGFSYGSMTAFMSAAKRNPTELGLCSLSPYFSDDMSEMKKSWLANIGHRRADVFRSLDFNLLAKKIQCKTLIFVGEVEAEKYPSIARRSEIATEKIANSQCIFVPGTDHDVADEKYVQAIKEAI